MPPPSRPQPSPALPLAGLSAAPGGWPLAAALGAVCAVGSLIHRRLSGSWPLLPELDEWRLRATPLERLVEAYRANPRVSPLVVCLTTIPSRVENLQLTLKSLLRQEVRPAEIRLHLPEYSAREGRAYEVPNWLAELDVVTRVPCEDHGPATKMIPALDLPPRQLALVLDDDRIYGPRLVAEMDAAGRVRPDVVSCGSGWRIPVDLTDRPTTLGAVLRGEPFVPILGSNLTAPARVDVLQGLQSYLIQPRFFDRAEVVDYAGAPPEARYCDDVWISAHARAPRWVIPLSRISTSHRGDGRHLKATSLARNFNDRPDNEARANTVVMRHFRDRWATPG